MILKLNPLKRKYKLKGGRIIETNNKFLVEIFHNNYIQLELAMQIISKDQTKRNNTIQDLKDFNSQSLATQAKKREQLVSMMPAIKKALNLMGDDIIELSTKNDAFRNKIGAYDKKWLGQSKAKPLKQIHDEERAILIKVRMQEEMKRH